MSIVKDERSQNWTIRRDTHHKPLPRRPLYFEPDNKPWWPQGKRPERDGQKQKVYRAEDLFEARYDDPQMEVGDALQYVQWFLNRAWFQRRFPWFERLDFYYIERKGGSCHGGPRGVGMNEVISGRISMRPWGLNRHTLLHEFAHAVLIGEASWHGRRFARTYLEFIGAGISQDVKKIMQECYREVGVRYSPYREPSEAQREHGRAMAARHFKKS